MPAGRGRVLAPRARSARHAAAGNTVNIAFPLPASAAQPLPAQRLGDTFADTSRSWRAVDALACAAGAVSCACISEPRDCGARERAAGTRVCEAMHAQLT